jgi:hypothetical protein
MHTVSALRKKYEDFCVKNVPTRFLVADYVGIHPLPLANALGLVALVSMSGWERLCAWRFIVFYYCCMFQNLISDTLRSVGHSSHNTTCSKLHKAQSVIINSHMVLWLKVLL